MENKINIQKVGKLRVYIKAGEVVKSTNLFRKIFPKNVYSDLLDAAKKEGILMHMWCIQRVLTDVERIFTIIQ